jgi:Fur family transcriptional regulator, peroxide stress response regulator
MVAKKVDPAWVENKLSDFQTKCREQGLKITPQRMAIYRALLETTDHPAAEVLCRRVREQFPNVSLDTVNRTLLTLNDIGAAFIVEGSGDAKRFDGNVQDHQHFKCVRCKRIYDVFHEPFTEIEIPTDLEKQFTILRKTVYFEGICDQCRN